MQHILLIYSVTIFLSAFLLFQVQPIIGKYILPWFGGTSGVWLTSLLFFQILLLLGYSYSYLLSRFSLKAQTIIHCLLTFLTTLILSSLFFNWSSPITPSIDLKLPDTISPIVQVLTFLFISVGLPYFLLATTSTVLQNWFGLVVYKKSPYLLYAFSNAGSLLGIMSYPFIMEPFLSLQVQGIWWSIGFLLYGIILLYCCLKIFFSKQKNKTIAVDAAVAPIKKRVIGYWLFLSTTSSIMLMAVTSLLTQAVAPIPFLWLLPLGLYLLSFILCFSDDNWYWRNFYAYLFLTTGPLALVFTQSSAPTIWIGISVYSLALFSICMLCHGELYKRKPPSQQLNIFYLILALGGALGGIFVGIIAPLLFNGFWEIYVGFYLSLLLSFFVLVKYRNSSMYRKMHTFFFSSHEFYFFVLIGVPMIIFSVALTITVISGYDSVKTWRNFYGVLTYKTKQVGNETQAYLIHGRIIHGMQYFGKRQTEPVSYYHPRSGVGLLMASYPRDEKGIRVGVVGLGAGVLAAYGKKGDYYKFYDINPQVVDVAKNQFTYLKDSPATIDIALGDGRLVLEQEIQKKKEPYDILVVDAFSDDAIPVHLLTKEALQIYLKRLSSNGVLAFHISNNYLELKHIIAALAKDAQLEMSLIVSPTKGDYPRTEWVLLTRNKQFLSIPAIAVVESKNVMYKDISAWTDTYSNLFQILK